MPLDEPPRIRDEKRDPEITRIKERLAILEESDKSNSQLIEAVNYALFGIPQDRTNNGLVGEMADIKQSLRSANNKLMGLLVTVIGGVGIDILTRHS